MGLPRRELGDGERVVLRVRPHARVLARPALVLLVLSPLVGAALALLPDGPRRPWLLAVLAAAAGWTGFRYVLWPFLVWWHTVYAVTTERVLLRRGVLSRRGRDVPLHRVADVSFTRAGADRVLGSGRLVVVPEGSAPLVLLGVPGVVRVAAVLGELVDAAVGDDRIGDDGDGDDAEDLHPDDEEPLELVDDR